MTLIKYGVVFMVFLIALNYVASRLQNRQKVEEVPIEEPVLNTDFSLNIEISEDGECIYNPGSSQGYRYGPSMLINDDGSIDAFFSRPGNNGSMWDYISYRHMDPDGTWGSEEVVLRPTSGGLDGHSVCDPGVIYFDGYYYIGYTGTVNGEGLANQVFVARSAYVDGPYEKWNGAGWGGSPEPIIRYEGPSIYWGAGEISFVVDEDDNSMLCYYSWKDENEDSMRCSKVDLCEDWPSTIRFKCISFYKDDRECSSDVVYLKDLDLYLAFSMGKRMTDDPRVLVHYSKDGKVFEYYDRYKDVIMPYAHNMGISKHLDGSISFDDVLYIAYAYSDDNKWGRWKTYLQRISIGSVE